MKNLFWFIFLTVNLGFFIYLYSKDKVENEKMLQELKIGLEDIDSKEITQTVDSIITNIKKEKKEKTKLLDSLDLVIENNKKLRNSNIELEKNNREIVLLRLEKIEVIKNKEELVKLLDKNDSTLLEVEKQLHVLDNNYNKIFQENKILEKKYSDILSKYNESKLIKIDSSYQLDTILYKPKDVKKVKLRN